MKKFVFSFLITPLICASAFAYPNPSLEWIAKGDAAFADRDTPERAMEALKAYEKAIAADLANDEARWKASSAAWWAGTLQKEEKEKVAAFESGIQFARKAIELNGKSAEGYFWMGTNQGSLGETKGVMKSLFLIKPVRQAMASASELNEGYMGAGPCRVLGIMDYKIPRIAGGNRKRALERLQKALELAPKNPMNIYYLAEYYAEVGKADQAKEQLKTLEASDFPPELQPELRYMRSKADALSKKLK